MERQGLAGLKPGGYTIGRATEMVEGGQWKRWGRMSGTHCGI
jgi:hypothetical protein